MKKLLLWLVMVVVMLAVLLGGAGYAMYAMTGDDKLPTQHPTLGDTELEPIGYDWSVPVLGNVLNRTFEQPSTLTVQKLGEMTEAAPAKSINTIPGVNVLPPPATVIEYFFFAIFHSS